MTIEKISLGNVAFIIGIKHDLFCINICWAPEGGVETLSLKGEGFNKPEV